MKKLLTLIALSSVAAASADQYYNQRTQGNYQRNNQYDYQQPQNRGQYDVNQGNYDRSRDQEIVKKVQDFLSSGWFTKGYPQVHFEVNGGVVTLGGSVHNADDLKKVEDSIQKIEGVRQVNNQIRLAQGNTPNANAASNNKFPQDTAATTKDREINDKIRDKLNSGWFTKGYETVVLRTANGTVIISGTVDNFEDIQKIHDQIKDVDGVRSINHQLNVKKQ